MAVPSGAAPLAAAPIALSDAPLEVPLDAVASARGSPSWVWTAGLVWSITSATVAHVTQ
jgi:hypothetical protein